MCICVCETGFIDQSKAAVQEMTRSVMLFSPQCNLMERSNFVVVCWDFVFLTHSARDSELVYSLAGRFLIKKI